MKGVPSVDSAAGGRPIDQTVKVLFGFNSHIVEGGIHLVVPHAVREVATVTIPGFCECQVVSISIMMGRIMRVACRHAA